MWHRFNESAKKIVLYAQLAAEKRGRTDIAAEHLLLGLLREVAEKKSVWPPAPTDRTDPHDIAASLLRNIDRDKLLAAADWQITQLGLPAVDTDKERHLLPSGIGVIKATYAEARRLSAKSITPEFLLLGMYGPKTGETGLLLTQAGLDLQTARREVASIYQPAQENRARENRAKEERLTLWSRLFAKRTIAPGEKEIR